MPKAVPKAVFPVAGLGTRILPATKAMPKEMLTIVQAADPLCDDEAKAAGIEQFYFVNGRSKSATEDHFDPAFELAATSRDRGKSELLDELHEWLPAAGESLHPTAAAARVWPRRLVRPRSHRRRTLRGAAGR